MALSTDNITAQIKALKKQLQIELPDYKEKFEEVADALKSEVARIKDEELNGHSVPIYQYSDIESGFNEQQTFKIQRAGCVVIRGVLPEAKWTSTIPLWSVILLKMVTTTIPQRLKTIISAS